MRRGRARRVMLVATTFVALTATACSGGGPKALPAAPRQPALAYVALGGSDTFGTGTQDRLRNAWPHVLFRTALPRSATLVNLASTDANTDDLITRQVPEALGLHPDLVTISMPDDAFVATPTATFEARLRDAVRRLRADPKTRVLLANIPPLDRRPGYRACLPGTSDAADCRVDPPVPSPSQLDARVAAMNSAIARIAAAEGATLVDLNAAMLAERTAGREESEFFADDLSPDAAGSNVYAAAFAAAYTRAR